MGGKAPSDPEQWFSEYFPWLQHFPFLLCVPFGSCNSSFVKCLMPLPSGAIHSHFSIIWCVQRYVSRTRDSLQEAQWNHWCNLTLCNYFQQWTQLTGIHDSCGLLWYSDGSDGIKFGSMMITKTTTTTKIHSLWSQWTTSMNDDTQRE